MADKTRKLAHLALQGIAEAGNYIDAALVSSGCQSDELLQVRKFLLAAYTALEELCYPPFSSPSSE